MASPLLTKTYFMNTPKITKKSMMATINSVLVTQRLVWVKTWHPPLHNDKHTAAYSYSLYPNDYRCIRGHQLFSPPTEHELEELSTPQVAQLLSFITDEKIVNDISVRKNEITAKPLIGVAVDREGADKGVITVFIRIKNDKP